MHINKIEFSVSISELKSICSTIDFKLPEISQKGFEGQTMKSYCSIFIQVRTKLAKKLLAKQFMIKPFKLSLEYYEALALYKTIEILEKDRHAQNFFNKLDQKLA